MRQRLDNALQLLSKTGWVKYEITKQNSKAVNDWVDDILIPLLKELRSTNETHRNT